MRQRWKPGRRLQQIGKLFDRRHASIQTSLAKSGGIRPPGHRR
jgi:hypothetical protein